MPTGRLGGPSLKTEATTRLSGTQIRYGDFLKHTSDINRVLAWIIGAISHLVLSAPARPPVSGQNIHQYSPHCHHTVVSAGGP